MFVAVLLFMSLHPECKSYYQLPEIIVNKAISDGYNYPIPPIQFDEIPFIPQTTLQPPFQESFPSYIPPQNDIPAASPPVYLPPSSTYGVPNFKAKIANMSCSDAANDRFFRATVISAGNMPVLTENGNNDCVSGSDNIYHIDIAGAHRLAQCGVIYCSDKKICLQIRMPAVKGLKLPEDGVVSLQCRPQDPIASHVKQLRMKPLIVKGRGLSTVQAASGGAQRSFETQVVLLRRAPGAADHTQIVTPGSSVLLGEDLLLRAAVRDGDGWKYSRMGSVTVQKAGEASHRHDTVALVDERGCRAVNMVSVCPEHPRRLNSLVTTMPLRAFMFQDAKSGDEMVLSVRMQACLHRSDCMQDQLCDERSATIGTRAKRESGERNATTAAGVTDWESHLDFRVVLPGNAGPESEADSAFAAALLFGVAGCLMALLGAFALLAQRIRANRHLI